MTTCSEMVSNSCVRQLAWAQLSTINSDVVTCPFSDSDLVGWASDGNVNARMLGTQYYCQNIRIKVLLRNSKQSDSANLTTQLFLASF